MNPQNVALLLCLAALSPSPAARVHGCHDRHPTLHGLPHRANGWEALYPGLGLAGSTAGTIVVVTPEYYSHVCVTEYVDPPAGWLSADSHTHHETCGPQQVSRPYFDSDCIGQQFMAPRDVQVSSALLWGTQNLNNVPLAFPGIDFQGGDCIEVGDANQIFKREWEGYVDSGGTTIVGQQAQLTGIAESSSLDYLPYGVPARDRIVQNGIEISGFTASELGHLGGLNLSADLGGDIFANYAALSTLPGCAPLFDGDATATPNLTERFPWGELIQHFECDVAGPPPAVTGYKSDGTGKWSVPVFEIFQRDEGAVTGYMHHFWPIDTVVDDEDYGPGVGWDWFLHLGASYASDNIQCFPTEMRAAFPDNFEKGNTVWPLFAALDVAMGYADYLEAYNLELRDWNPDSGPTTYPCASGPVVACGEEDHHTTPLDAWYGMYYKLLSAGQRPGISAGSDGTCDTGCVPQTYVRVGNTAGLDASQIYDAYTANLAAGHASLATEAYQFLDLHVDGVEIGERVDLDGIGQVDAVVTYTLDDDLLNDPSSDTYFFKAGSAYFDDDDRIVELVHDGAVVASVTLDPTDFSAGIATLPFSNLDVYESGWMAARTRSTSVHTAATMLTVDDEPIAKCLEAEYWMIYCDYIQFKIDAYDACQMQTDGAGQPVFVPEVLEQHVACFQSDMNAHLTSARKIFRSFRDLANGDLPGVCRHGEKVSSSCTEPMSIVVGGELSDQPGSVLRLSCVNAPPDTVGLLYFGSASAGPIVPGVAPPYFVPNITTQLVFSNHGGHHELEIPLASGFPGAGTIYAQYGWLNPVGCNGGGSGSWTRAVSMTIDPASAYFTCP